MKKKEIEEKVDYELDPEIHATITRNYRKAFNNLQIERENKKIREKKKNKILKILICVVVIVTVALLVFIDYRLTSNAQKSCIQMGHSENYCYEKL